VRVRADARRNRSLIVGAAVGLLTERGAAVSMEDIAREAGVGVGTLYRHFPDRRALLVRIGVDALRDLAGYAAAEADHEPAWEALLRIVDRCVALPLALIKSLTEDLPEDPELAALEAEVNGLIAQVVARAQRAGDLRADVPPPDVVRVLNVMVCRPGARADDHLARVLLDGLCTRKDRDEGVG
jgi:AcrR family transcriptional regulator